MARSDFGPQPLKDGSLGTLPAKPVRDLLLDDGSDRFNLACTRIAIVMLAGVAAIYVETLI